ncbi:MAG: 4Fe-4S dicluster domain-containing protein [Actinomycetota bacterium]
MEYAFLLDMSRCIGCEACVVACKTGNELPQGAQYIELNEKTSGTFPNLTGGFQNQRCYHCRDAACVSVCPTGALFKEGGLTRLNSSACSGCGYCVQACPYDVPKMVNGKSTKCDGCASTVASGGSPWCVQTCPSQALRYDTRDNILAEAHKRVDAIKDRYPNAQVYGETQAGGLGMILVLPDDPETLDIPADPPPVPIVTDIWKNVIQPASMAATAVAAVGAGVLGIIARKNHLAELREVEEQELAIAGVSESGSEEE